MKLLHLIKQNAYLLLILLAASFLRIYHADFQSIWDDEIVTIRETNPFISFKDAKAIFYEYDNMPPLYFIVLRCLFTVFGYSTLVLRLFSAVLGILGIYGIYLLGKELINKKTGLYAALILSVNYFNIYYSQEGRPYTFLVLFTVLSFYRLVRFINVPTIANALLYALFTVLMLYGQYFSIFTFAGQCLILLYFLVTKEKQNRMRFFWLTLSAGVTMAILFLPAMPQLIKNSAIKSSWIPAPTIDLFTSMLSEFFGKSELIMAFIYLMLLVFFIKLFDEKKEEGPLNQKQNPLVFSAFIIIPWIVVTMLLPLIRSYLVLPMIVNRYFNHVIPAIIILISIGFYKIQHAGLRNFLLAVFIVFSLTDVFIIKNYYKEVTKAEYNLASDFVIKNRKNNDKVVSRIGWHFGYFFNTNTPRIEVEWATLDQFIGEMTRDTTKTKSFWYVTANENPVVIGEPAQAFLTKYFVIDLKKDAFRTNATHYEKKPAQ